MNTLTDLEYRILDELYFVSSFESLMDHVGDEREEVLRALKELVTHGLVTQMKYENGVEEKLDLPDLIALEQSYFVASKKGLLIHNSRN